MFELLQAELAKADPELISAAAVLEAAGLTSTSDEKDTPNAVPVPENGHCQPATTTLTRSDCPDGSKVLFPSLVPNGFLGTATSNSSSMPLQPHAVNDLRVDLGATTTLAVTAEVVMASSLQDGKVIIEEKSPTATRIVQVVAPSSPDDKGIGNVKLPTEKADETWPLAACEISFPHQGENFVLILGFTRTQAHTCSQTLTDIMKLLLHE